LIEAKKSPASLETPGQVGRNGQEPFRQDQKVIEADAERVVPTS
jgi:hypothetical protein